MNNVKRPIVIGTIWFILGLIGGVLYLEKIQMLPLFCVVNLLIGSIMGKRYGKKSIVLMSIGLLLGSSMVIYHPVNHEKAYFNENEYMILQGKVSDITQGEYYKTVILKEVKLSDSEKRLWSKVAILLDKNEIVEWGDELRVTGKIKSVQAHMNPTDFNYASYLKAKNQVATLKVEKITRIEKKTHFIKTVRRVLEKRIAVIYNQEDYGIMQAVLVGDNRLIPKDLKTLYSRVGISHVLCVSGFHVGLVIAGLMLILSYMKIPYTSRHIILLGGIWSYAYLTGLGISTLRASIMASFVIGARLLWEEEDLWTNVAVAALLILCLSPYELFQVGFQLSFVAVLSIGIGQLLLEKLALKIDKKSYKIISYVLPTLLILFLTTPIVAYHFFEIPLLACVLNLLMIPLFSIIILVGWLSVGISYFCLPVAIILGKGIIGLLDGVKVIGTVLYELPLGTFCVGRPSIYMIVAYYITIGILLLTFCGYFFNQRMYIGLVLIWSVYIVGGLLRGQQLEITSLYVGQGDGIVITTPHQKVIVIDGGDVGKGEVLERYIKSKGKRHITALIVSHSDSDHIGGLIDLLKTNISVEAAFVSKTDASSYLNEFLSLCDNKEIPVYTVGEGDGFQIDDVSFACLGPRNEGATSVINNSSLIYLMHYKNFSALFTGDKEEGFEKEIYDRVEQLRVLKVSHHGSYTGTSEELLLKLNPRYAIISCGIANRYGHPHEQVLEALAQCEVPYDRTDKVGAVVVRTDGNEMRLSTQRKEADSHATN